jgi:hypothetical protein
MLSVVPVHMSRSPSEATEPSLRQLSQALGVPELRCGRHALRDQKGWLDDEIEAGYLWHARVMPSFHPWADIGLVHMDQSEFRGKEHPSITRAAMVLFDREGGQVLGWSATEVESDPLAEAIRGIQLLPGRKSMSLDGISYRICTSDWEIEASFHMQNPRTASLCAIERSLFSVASAVQKHTGNDQIALYLNSWQEYLER